MPVQPSCAIACSTALSKIRLKNTLCTPASISTRWRSVGFVVVADLRLEGKRLTQEHMMAFTFTQLASW